MPRMSLEELRRRAVACLRRAGVGRRVAGIVVDHMLAADLVGRSSHGLAVRLPQVLRKAREGAGRRRPRVVRDGGHWVVVDGRDGFGYLAGHFATELLIERARAHGVASVALRNTSHTGMLGYYAHMAARAGVVAMAFGDCSPLMAPAGGSRPLLGTNPIAFGLTGLSSWTWRRRRWPTAR